MVDFDEWVDEHFPVVEVGNKEYLVIYEDRKQLTTQRNRISREEFYEMIGDIVEEANDLYGVEEQALRDRDDQEGEGYDYIIDQWAERGILQ